jgi:hypothetical protein
VKHFIFAILLVLVACFGGPDHTTEHGMMQDITPKLNAVGKAIKREDAFGAKESYKALDAYIKGTFYLNWRERLQPGVQLPYRVMEKRVFELGEAVNHTFADMTRAYNKTREYCLKCHYNMRQDNRPFLNREIFEIKK